MQFYKEKLSNNSILYRPNGEITAFSMETLDTDISDEAGKADCAFFTFDFSRVHYIDSQGIRLLVIAGKYNHAREKKLEVKHIQPRVRRILEFAELSFLEFSE
ncbi:MAG: STAS domain-containing protein [Brevinematales bacterium]|nr:STAS domain-containing protein [Brevinematales bacterium]